MTATCRHGHLLTPSNLVRRSDSGRFRCRECQRLDSARLRDKRRTGRSSQHRVIAPDPSPYTLDEANAAHVAAFVALAERYRGRAG